MERVRAEEEKGHFQLAAGFSSDRSGAICLIKSVTVRRGDIEKPPSPARVLKIARVARRKMI
jgi:hypothetical protein